MAGKNQGGSLLREVHQKDRMPSQNALVKRANRLVEASHNLTLRQMQLINWLIRVVQEDDEDYKYYDVPMPLFLEYLDLGTSGSARDQIRDLTKELQERTVFIQINDDEWERFAWLRYVRVLKKDNRLTLRLSINPEMKPYIRDLKSAFTKTPFFLITAFRSKYAWRFYEWCKQFEDTGWLIIDVADLRSRLQIREHEYQRFNNLRQRVINPAVKELNEVSDLSVELAALEKRGRAVHRLKFKISRKQTYVIAAEGSEADERGLIAARFVRHGMPQAEAARNVKRYYDVDRDHLLGCLAEIEHRIESGFNFKDDNPLIWLRHILKNDPRQEPTLFTHVYRDAVKKAPSPAEIEARERKERVRERIEYLQRVIDAADTGFLTARRERHAELLDTVDEAARNKWRDAYLSHSSAIERTIRQSSFWENRANLDAIDDFLRSQGLEPLARETWLLEQGIDRQQIDREMMELEALAS